MTPGPSFGDQIRRDSLEITKTLFDGTKLVGGIYHLTYKKAIVLTNDQWKLKVGGVPRSTFLLATTLQPDRTAHPDEEEFLLLRVDGVANLPREHELIEIREEAMREKVTTDGEAALARDDHIVDVLTRNEMQFSGLDCAVLGTFYDGRDDAGRQRILLGTDLDTIYAASRYLVYKPTGASLAFIASYAHPKPADAELAGEPHRIRLGTVRYTSTQRRSVVHHESPVPVDVRVDDFISMKTAVLGMTRFGKSNTMKMLATAVFAHSKRTGQPVGQLFFDPASEYASRNRQDRTSLASIGAEHVSIYRFGLGDNEAEPGLFPLQINFFDPAQLHLARRIIEQALAESQAKYLQRFVAADLNDPADADDHRGRAIASRARLAFYAALAKAGFSGGPNQAPFSVAMNKTIRDKVDQDLTGWNAGVRSNGWVQIRFEQLRPIMDWLVAHQTDSDVADWSADESFQAVMPLYTESASRSGAANFAKVRQFHNHRAVGDYCHNIYSDLVAGKIVIVDMRRGDDRVLQVLAENVITHILASASDRFARDERNHRIQIFIEEAHRLFDRQSFLKDSPDPYVRLAKEAAKYEIGVVFATQEVSSVAPNVLSNTSNWIVAHLNNSREIAKLCEYYDFDAFKDVVLSGEDRGFVRVKTQSGRYIVPLQVDKFDESWINQAREAAGLPALPPEESTRADEPSQLRIDAEDL
jgi:hypothetical protein